MIEKIRHKVERAQDVDDGDEKGNDKNIRKPFARLIARVLNSSAQEEKYQPQDEGSGQKIHKTGAVIYQKNAKLRKPPDGKSRLPQSVGRGKEKDYLSFKGMLWLFAREVVCKIDQQKKGHPQNRIFKKNCQQPFGGQEGIFQKEQSRKNGNAGKKTGHQYYLL